MTKILQLKGGSIAQWLSILASVPAATDSIPSGFFQMKKIVDVGGVNQWRCLEENEQRLKTVDRTHLVLASGKLVLQKNVESSKLASLVCGGVQLLAVLDHDLEVLTSIPASSKLFYKSLQS